jgi:tetratricopeptide (TPR) repeat protein
MRRTAWDAGAATGSSVAAAALESATRALLAMRDDVPRHLADALAADPDLVAAHAVLGLLHLASGRAPRHDEARRCLAAARAAFARRSGTGREAALILALAAWLERGDMWLAAEHLDRHLQIAPADPLLFRIGYGIRFMLGDPVGMRIAAHRVLQAVPADAPLRGYLRGCHAFALGETGERRRAEAEARRALEEAPDDLWAAHAVAHVLEETGRAQDGIAWLRQAAPHEAGAQAFGRHLHWHRALFHLHLGDGGAALDLYDSAEWRQPGADFRDLANAASLLWRLQAQGVPVGPRWDALAEEAERRLGEHVLAFADLHHAVALAGAGRRGPAARLLRGLRQQAQMPGSQADVLHRLGLDVMRGVVAAMLGDPAEAALLLHRQRNALQELGGSHAQRDLLPRMLVEAALAAGDAGMAERVLLERARTRPGGAWEAMCLARIAALHHRAARAEGVPPTPRCGAWPRSPRAGTMRAAV